MADHKTTDLRNLLIAGHGASGKTTIAEAMLLETGVTNRMGKPREGTSVLDFDEEEKERRFSIFSTLLYVKHKGKQLQIIDTPGYDDFFGEVASSCAAVETALVAVAADAGVQVNTRRVWKRAEQQGLARAIVITKMDAENAKYDEVLGNIQALFGKACVPVTLPVGVGPAFCGVVSTLNLPADAGDQAAAAANALKEAIIESDDALMERYLGEEEIAASELMAAASRAVAKGTLVPVFCCAAEKRLGVAELLDGIVSLFPSPVEGLQRTCVKLGTDEAAERPPQEDAPFAAQVFKALYDPYVGKLAFLRVFSGTLKPEDGLFNARAGERSKLGHIYRMQGKEQVEVDSAVPGDLIVVAKVESLEVSDTLCDESAPVTYPPIVFPTPMVSRAAEPKTRADEQRMSTALARIASQDKTFLAGREEQTGELVITGMSDLHLDVVMGKLGRKPFEVEMNLKEPRIPYKETISGKNSTSYRHKKQTGGRGQFAEVHLRVEPLERGAEFEFVDEIYGGAIPRQFVPAVEKGVRETMAKGVIAGCPVVDVRVAVYDGKYHEVDSSEAAFKIASSRAFSEAFRGARPQLLEPIVNMEITVPSKYFGDISGDLSGRRGRIQGMGVEGDQQTISAQVPLAEVSNYSTQLRSITGGEGSYTMEFSHYEAVPARIQEVIVAKAAKAKAGEDEE
ncbi:MAG: elongation factor G [Planctomycetes bacterium]|nr:elongation factor G [Planctomycetota bacterium]